MSAPTTFEDFAALEGVGVAWYVDVSLDNFATAAFKNYSSTTMLLGTFQYEPRIISMGKLARVFGATRGFSAGTFSLDLDNTDGGCDWLMDRTTYATQTLRAKFALYCVLYDPNDFSSRYIKYLGYYMQMDPPERTDSLIRLSLADDTLGDVATLAATPSIRDWINIADAARPPLLTTYAIGTKQKGLIPNFDYDAPTPLLFGPNPLPIQRVAGNCYVICAVAGSASGLPLGVTSIQLNDGFRLPIYVQKGEGTPATQITYQVRRTPDIVKNGRTFHLLWVDLYLNPAYYAVIGYELYESYGMRTMLTARGYDVKNGEALFDYSIHDLVAPVTVIGTLLSHPVNDVTDFKPIHAVTVVQDLLTYYARRITAPLDTASFDAVKAARPGLSVSGVVESGINRATTRFGNSFSEVIDGNLVSALRGICSLGAFDLFMTSFGVVRMSCLLSDFSAQTAVFPTLDETLLLPGTTEKIPAAGERNAPYNRVFFLIGNDRLGPLDDKAAIAAWGKIVAIEVDVAWLSIERYFSGQYRQDVSNLNSPLRPDVQKTPYASLGGSTIRPMLTVRTWLNGLSYELGDYIYMSWSRGTIGGPYVNSTFRVEGISLDAMSCTVELQLLWVDDLRSSTNLPYLLDDEALNVRATGSGGRTVTVNGGSSTATFSSGSLTTDGVVPGDLLVLQDATEAVNGFNRNAVYRIANVVSSTIAALTPSLTGGGGPYVLSTWTIVRGATTYRSNAAYFGKTTDSAGLFSNSAPGNQVLEG